MRLQLILLAYAVGLFTAPAQSDEEIAQIIRKFEVTYRSSRTLRAAFVEKYIESGKLVRSDAGVAYFLKPGKMRWEYQSPEQNLYVVDGKWSWFYVPTDHTVTKVVARQSTDTRAPFALLAGEVKVSKVCKSVEKESSAAGAGAGVVELRCNLRDDEAKMASAQQQAGMSSPARTSYAIFELNSKSGQLNRVVLYDPGGVQIEFLFAQWQFDPQLDGAMFQFHPPQGVAIVNGDLPSGSLDAARPTRP